MEAEESSKPFWSRSYSASSSSSSNPNATSSNFKPYILAFISTSIIAILFFPSLLFTSSFKSFRPSLLKNGWDLLNFLLVVFAVLCGVLGRNHSDDTSAASPSSSSAAADPSQQHPNPMAASSNVDGVEWAPPIRRMRNSSSYPDLRQEQWWTEQDNNHSWQRYYDDSYVYDNNSFNRRSGPLQYGRHQQSIGGNYNTGEIKTVQAELIKESIVEEERSRSPPPPPPPPPPRHQHEHQHRRRPTRKSIPDPPPLPPSTPPPRQLPVIPDPPPLPPPTPPRPKIQRKKSSGAKEIAVAVAQFYQKKRKRSSGKTKKKTQDKDDAINDTATRVSSAPPTPPPPPPKMTFHSLFSNKSKKKSVPDPPPLPTPKKNYPLPYSPLRPMPRRQREGLPPKVPERFSSEYYNSDSNLSEILPPPPPPPPESAPESPAFGDDSQQVFCPSPDLNVKAEKFIKWFHDGLRLEKIHSIKEKEKQEKERLERLVQGNEEIVELS